MAVLSRAGWRQWFSPSKGLRVASGTMNTLLRGPRDGITYPTRITNICLVTTPSLSWQGDIVSPRQAITSKTSTAVGPILCGDEQDHGNT